MGGGGTDSPAGGGGGGSGGGGQKNKEQQSLLSVNIKQVRFVRRCHSIQSMLRPFTPNGVGVD